MDIVGATWARYRRPIVTGVVLLIVFLIAFRFGAGAPGSPSNCAGVPGLVTALTYLGSIVVALILVVVGAILAYARRSWAVFGGSFIAAVLIPIGVFVGVSVSEYCP